MTKVVKHVVVLHELEAHTRGWSNTINDKCGSDNSLQQKIKVGQKFAIVSAVCRQASAADFHLYENKTLGSPR